jgi:hypothetical protein
MRWWVANPRGVIGLQSHHAVSPFSACSAGEILRLIRRSIQQALIGHDQRCKICHHLAVTSPCFRHRVSSSTRLVRGLLRVVFFGAGVFQMNAQVPGESARKWGSPCAELFSKLFSAEPVRVPRFPMLGMKSTKEEVAASVNGVIEVSKADLTDKAAASSIFAARRRLFIREGGVDERPVDFLETGVERVRVLAAEPADENGARNLYGWQENKPEELRPYLAADVAAGSKAPKEKDGLVDVEVPGGLKSEAAFLESLKRKDGQELVILAGANGQGLIVFQDGSRMDVNLALLKIREAGHLALSLSCDAESLVNAPSVVKAADVSEEFIQALKAARKTLREKGCHQFYVGDYLFSLDEYFHERKVGGTEARFALKPTGAGAFAGVLILRQPTQGVIHPP